MSNDWLYPKWPFLVLRVNQVVIAVDQIGPATETGQKVDSLPEPIIKGRKIKQLIPEIHGQTIRYRLKRFEWIHMLETYVERRTTLE